MADIEAAPRASTSSQVGASSTGTGDVTGEGVTATQGSGAPSGSTSSQTATASTSTARASGDAPRSPAAAAAASSPVKSTPVASDFAHAALRKFKLVFLGEQSGGWTAFAYTRYEPIY